MKSKITIPKNKQIIYYCSKCGKKSIKSKYGANKIKCLRCNTQKKLNEGFDE